MTDISSPSASEAESAAASWLERRACTDWDAGEQVALDDWLAQSPAHEIAYLRLEAAWIYADRLAAVRKPMRPAAAPTRRLPNALYKAVAVIFIGLIASSGGLYFALRPDQTTYETAIGGRRTIALADGSQIELNTDTILRADITARRRKLWLDKGEAYFQVKHDASHPFTVIVGNHRITDLGTKFLIRRDPRRIEVSLLEGRARFDAPHGNMKPSALDLSPGDRVTVEGGSIVLTRQSPLVQERDLAWRRGLLVFDGTALADAAEEFNRYNREKIVIKDPMIGRTPIGGTFRADNISSFISVAQDVFGFHVVTKDGVTVISR